MNCVPHTILYLCTFVRRSLRARRRYKLGTKYYSEGSILFRAGAEHFIVHIVYIQYRTRTPYTITMQSNRLLLLCISMFVCRWQERSKLRSTICSGILFHLCCFSHPCSFCTFSSREKSFVCMCVREYTALCDEWQIYRTGKWHENDFRLL